MKSTFAALALLAASAAAQNAFTISTPSNVVECEPTLLSWSGGTPPYYLSILPGNQPSAAALENLGTQTGTSYTWSTNIAAGTSVGLTLRDSTGAVASSAPFTINSGSSSSCLTASASGSASASSTLAPSGSAASSAASSAADTTSRPAATSTAPSATAASSTSAAGSLSSAASVASSAASVASSAASSAAGSATTSAAGSSSTGAASINLANMGVAAVAGAAVMAILV